MAAPQTYDIREAVDALSGRAEAARIFRRGLLLTAVEAIRRGPEPETTPSIVLTPSRDGGPLRLLHPGAGPDADDLRAALDWLTTPPDQDDGDGSLPDEPPALAALQSWAVCLSVAARVEVRVTRRGTGGATTLVLTADGVATLEDDGDQDEGDDETWEGGRRPGTVVTVHPREENRTRCESPAVKRDLVRGGGLVELPIVIGKIPLAQTGAPWDLPTLAQAEWCAKHLGFDPLGIVADDAGVLGARSLMFVRPLTPSNTSAGDLVFSRGVLLDEKRPLLPDWGFLCRTVVEAGELPVDRGMMWLAEGEELTALREHLDTRLHDELAVVRGQHPKAYAELAAAHGKRLTRRVEIDAERKAGAALVAVAAAVLPEVPVALRVFEPETRPAVWLEDPGELVLNTASAAVADLLAVASDPVHRPVVAEVVRVLAGLGRLTGNPDPDPDPGDPDPAFEQLSLHSEAVQVLVQRVLAEAASRPSVPPTTVPSPGELAAAGGPAEEATQDAAADLPDDGSEDEAGEDEAGEDERGRRAHGAGRRDRWRGRRRRRRGRGRGPRGGPSRGRRRAPSGSTAPGLGLRELTD